MNKKMLGSILGALTITAAPALARAGTDEKTEETPAPKKKDASEKGHKGGDKSCGAKKGGDKSCGGDKKGGDKSCGGDKGGDKSCGGAK